MKSCPLSYLVTQELIETMVEAPNLNKKMVQKRREETLCLCPKVN